MTEVGWTALLGEVVRSSGEVEGTQERGEEVGKLAVVAWLLVVVGCAWVSARVVVVDYSGEVVA